MSRQELCEQQCAGLNPVWIPDVIDDALILIMDIRDTVDERLWRSLEISLDRLVCDQSSQAPRAYPKFARRGGKSVSGWLDPRGRKAVSR